MAAVHDGPGEFAGGEDDGGHQSGETQGCSPSQSAAAAAAAAEGEGEDEQ